MDLNADKLYPIQILQNCIKATRLPGTMLTNSIWVIDNWNKFVLELLAHEKIHFPSVTHTCNLSPREAKAGRWGIWWQPGLQCKGVKHTPVCIHALFLHLCVSLWSNLQTFLFLVFSPVPGSRDICSMCFYFTLNNHFCKGSHVFSWKVRVWAHNATFGS